MKHVKCIMSSVCENSDPCIVVKRTTKTTEGGADVAPRQVNEKNK